MARSCRSGLVLVCLLTFCALPLMGQERAEYIEAVRSSHQRRDFLGASDAEASTKAWKRAWVASWAALAATNALDIHSSQGKRELNPVLRDANGSFSTPKAVGVKGALSGGFLLVQALSLKRSPTKRKYKSFAIANYAVAAGVATVAARNYGVRRK